VNFTIRDQIETVLAAYETQLPVRGAGVAMDGRPGNATPELAGELGSKVCADEEGIQAIRAGPKELIATALG
jgi:hypothetical protein